MLCSIWRNETVFCTYTSGVSTPCIVVAPLTVSTEVCPEHILPGEAFEVKVGVGVTLR